MDRHHLEKVAKMNMDNGCTDTKIALVSLAVQSHPAFRHLIMQKVEDDKILIHDFGRVLVRDNPENAEGQEVLFIKLTINGNKDIGVILGSKTDLVSMVYLLPSTNQVCGTVCKMTVSNFIKFLNTIPNYFLFAEPGSFGGNESPEGVELLKGKWLVE